MSDRDLRLNSVSRYSKESSRLILEEHGHCEIPAGCGGVVLRWFNPVRAVPLSFRMYVNGETDFALDGVRTESARPLVEYGEHVLSFVVRSFDSKTGILMFAATVESRAKSPAAKVIRYEFISDADGSWKYTLNAPKGDSWMAAGFDDTDWQTLVLRPVPKPAAQGSGSFWHGKMLELGARGLGIAEPKWTTRLFGRAPSSDQIWIRKVFHLTRESKRRSGR